MGSKYIQIAIENFGYILAINSNFWQEYFQLNLSDALTDTDEKKIILFMKKYIKPVMGSFDMGDWQRLNNWLKEFIDEMIQNYFNGDGEGSMFTKIKQYLNKISLNHSSELFDNQLSILAERLLLTGAYLFGSELTKADLSLFSVLVQYFEESEKTLENQTYVGKGKKKIYEEDLDEIVEFKEDRGKGSTSNRNLDDAYIDWRIQIIYEFIERIKRHLGFANNQEWKSLQVEPWILNYETEKHFSKKYDGKLCIPNVYSY
uniref:Uncharacterized protein n=1 Tax=Meloidogyne javanica TaxID=6303 RepID=A0A915MYL6_MELJA